MRAPRSISGRTCRRATHLAYGHAVRGAPQPLALRASAGRRQAQKNCSRGLHVQAADRDQRHRQARFEVESNTSSRLTAKTVAHRCCRCSTWRRPSTSGAAAMGRCRRIAACGEGNRKNLSRPHQHSILTIRFFYIPHSVPPPYRSCSRLRVGAGANPHRWGIASRVSVQTSSNVPTSGH